MKKINIKILTIISFISFAFGQDPNLPPQMSPKTLQMKKWMENGLNEKTYRDVEGFQLNANKNFRLLKNLQVSLHPKVVPLFGSTTIQIDLHPIYGTKVYLPKGAEIIKLFSTENMKELTHLYNRADIRPRADFVSCSIDITYLYNNKIFDVTVIANKYDVSKLNNKDNIFYPKIILTLDKPLTPVDALKLYKQSYGDLPQESVVFFSHKNITYKIEKDSFVTPDPYHRPNATALYKGENHKYKISVGSEE